MTKWIDTSDWRFKRSPVDRPYADIGRDRRPTPEMIEDARRGCGPRTMGPRAVPIVPSG